MTTKICYYEVLGIQKTSSQEEIKRAYRKIALKYHPDRCPGDNEAEDKFKAAAEAYEILSNPEKRNVYDQYGHAGLNDNGYQGFNSYNDIFSAFGDIFQDFFGSGYSKPKNAPIKGRNLSYEAIIEFKDSYTGTDLKLQLPKEQDCESCDGTGSKNKAKATCPHCNGQGQILQGAGFIRLASTCPTCHGTGEIPQDSCPDCRGRGRVTITRDLVVKIPAGVSTGSRLRLRGEGESGQRGGSPGDLYVEIFVKHDPVFSREKYHVIIEQEIDMVNAALGTQIQVPTVTGEKATLKIPAGTQNGKILKISGLGFPNPSSPTRGDMLVSMSVKTPVDLTERQHELLSEFMAIEEEKKLDGPLKNWAKKAGEKIKRALT